MNDDLDYKLYVLAEITYKKENEDKSEEELFPFDWYSIKNYKYKVEIIGEALKKNILIKETELYKERVEGIRDENIDKFL